MLPSKVESFPAAIFVFSTSLPSVFRYFIVTATIFFGLSHQRCTVGVGSDQVFLMFFSSVGLGIAMPSQGDALFACSSAVANI